MKETYLPGVLFTVLQMGMTTNQMHVVSEQVAPENTMCEVNQSIDISDQIEEVEAMVLPEVTPTAAPVVTPSPAPVEAPVASDEAPVAPVATPVATPTPVVKPTVTAPADLDPLFEKYAGEYGISASTLKVIANCESHYNPGAMSSNGLYGGMFQYSASTWKSTRTAMGMDPNPDLRFSAEESIRTSAFKIANGGIGAWPVCGAKAQAI